MENKKITEFVHVDESNEEKMSAKITIQSFKDEIKEIDVPKGIVTFLGSKNGKRIPYLTKNRYSVSDLVHCQRKSLYKQLGLKPEQLVQDLSIEQMWSTVRGDFLHQMTNAYDWNELEMQYQVNLKDGKHATLHGRLDMYDWKTKTIMDLKSVTNLRHQVKHGFIPKLQHILQVQCYGTMFESYIPIENLNLVYVDNIDIVTYKIQKRDMTDWIKTRIQEIEDACNTKQIIKGEPTGLCQFCKYQTKCHTDGNGITHTPLSVPKGGRYN
tara:strand:- start:1454 stop:2260 length:807 start_codon:yes stop_codon:yes gene_type:complete